MKIVITGSNGFIGKKLSAHFRQHEHEVVGLDIDEDIHTLRCDITRDNLDDLIPDGADAVIHLAALSRDKDCSNNAQTTNQVNILGTQRLVEAAQKKGVKQFIFASTEWVYDNFDDTQFKTEESIINLHNLDSEYAASKYVAESNLKLYFKHYQLPTTILRFGIIYGPRKENWSAVEALLNNVASKQKVEVGCLKTGRCFIHVDDVITGIEATLGLPGFEILNLQGDEFVTLQEVLDAAQKSLNKQVEIGEGNSSQPSIRKVSNSKMKNMLEWTPKYNIYSGIEAIKNEVLN